MYVKSLKDFNYVELYDDIVFEDKVFVNKNAEILSTGASELKKNILSAEKDSRSSIKLNRRIWNDSAAVEASTDSQQPMKRSKPISFNQSSSPPKAGHNIVKSKNTVKPFVKSSMDTSIPLMPSVKTSAGMPSSVKSTPSVSATLKSVKTSVHPSPSLKTAMSASVPTKPSFKSTPITWKSDISSASTMKTSIKSVSATKTYPATRPPPSKLVKSPTAVSDPRKVITLSAPKKMVTPLSIPPPPAPMKMVSPSSQPAIQTKLVKYTAAVSDPKKAITLSAFVTTSPMKKWKK